MSRGCYFDSAGCYVCPQYPATPYIAPHTQVDPDIGWTAGADSIIELPGDVRLAWSLDTLPVGIIVGLRANRAQPLFPSTILHGWYVYSQADMGYAQQLEKGVLVGSPVSYGVGQLLEVRRLGTQVQYWLQGQLMATRPALHSGVVFAGSCLYAAGDSVPSAA